MKFLAAILVLASSLYSTAVRADLLLEPLVGYNFNAVLDFKDGERYSGGTGPSFGGRIGYQNLGLQLGLDYLHSSLDMDDSDIDDKVTADEYAAFVGFKFPILLRVYAGYIFAASAETKDAAGQKYEFSKASGYKAGVGFTGLPFVNINLEYRKGTFDEIEVDGTEADGGADYQSIMLGLSLPFAI